MQVSTQESQVGSEFVMDYTSEFITQEVRATANLLVKLHLFVIKF